MPSKESVETDPNRPGSGPRTSPPPSAPQLDRALTSGLAWTGAMRFAVQAVTWVATLIVLRILSPDDIGLVALAAVYLGVITLLSEFGIGSSVVVLRDLEEDQIARLSGVAIAVGALCFLLSIPAAPLLAAFFRSSELTNVVIGMSVSFIFVSFRTVPASLLQRDLDFRTLAVLETVRALVQSGLMVTLALLGFGYWSLVIANVAGAAVHAVTTFIARPHRIAWPRRGALRRPLTFSLDILGSRLSWYLWANADFVVAGRVFSDAIVGAYSMAWTFASVPVEKVSALAMQVTPSVLAAVQKDKPALRRYLLRLTEGIALITFPAAIGLALVADRFVLVLLTDKYAAGIDVLRVLAFYAAVRSISTLFNPVLTALALTGVVLRASLLGLLIMPLAFYGGSRWGILGIAAAWAIAHPLVILYAAVFTFRSIELRIRDYFRALWPATSGCLAIAAVVLALRFGMPASLTLAARLVIESVAGAAAYGAVVGLAHRQRITSFRKHLRELRSGEVPAS